MIQKLYDLTQYVRATVESVFTFEDYYQKME